MHNYEHEIICPNNKAIISYLWFDYFHDSKLKDITFEKNKKTLIMTLECSRDIDMIWDKLKGNDDERRSYIKEHIKDFSYNLIFKGVKYFHLERMIFCSEYLNGRFKDTALLQRINFENKKPCLHFRIQFDDGYGDIIFKDFSIRILQGRVSYYKYDGLVQSSAAFTLDEIDEQVVVANSADDFDRFIAMQNLWKIRGERLLNLARKNIARDEHSDDAKQYATYLVGKLGDKSDLPILFERYMNIEKEMTSQSYCLCSTLLPKRNILDAIESIRYREEVNIRSKMDDFLV